MTTWVSQLSMIFMGDWVRILWGFGGHYQNWKLG